MTVILNTQPDEPFPYERSAALRGLCRSLGNASVSHTHRQMEQNPEAPGFWEMWKHELRFVTDEDIIVSSELYGLKLAEITGAKFMPYDIDRSIAPIKATAIREDPKRYFHYIMPEFQKFVRQTVTLFGAESTGKTTLSSALAHNMGGFWLPEWARPYLETCGTEITTKSMTDIWDGQRALQAHAQNYFYDRPWIFQDTDLFSTVGYWDLWNMQTPEDLRVDAAIAKSDIYLITKSNIPFEPDPIRYGGNVRESKDEFWIELCETHHLPYYIVQSDGLIDRISECYEVLNDHWQKAVVDRLRYTRIY